MVLSVMVDREISSKHIGWSLYKMFTKINFNGEILKEARLKQNRTLDELAQSICSNSRQLEAIENNNYEILQAAEIRKIVIKRYAYELKIDIAIAGDD